MIRKPRKDERQARILEALRHTPHIRIALLAERFKVTTETIRRDLESLSQRGLVNRAHGGVVAQPMGVQPSIFEREQSTVDERSRIAMLAASFVSSGQVLMMDAGSTTTQLAWQLARGSEALTVITNSYPVASALTPSQCTTIVCPGEFNGHEGGVFGQDTTEFLGRFHANIAFIGASGLGAGGVMDVNRQAAWVKRTMIERCEHIYLLADHTKFDLHVLEVVAPLDALSGVITDRAPPDPLAHALREAGVACHIASNTEAPDSVLPDFQEKK
ncbi:MAG: DeoR/GlpR family DNA-binding transcription regulator [Burkholderiaceae bacterium]